ncbi:hypothetical protein NST84_15680 [Paenibacillus sp. FSL R7-0345]|uniref:hypothetical protein n=1 Tax=Paenibacillus sp. FSL R7-0345 TaxID=2954535 RepID=UPI00315B1882
MKAIVGSVAVGTSVAAKALKMMNQNAGQQIISKPTQEAEVVIDLLEALQKSVKMSKSKPKPRQVAQNSEEKLG